MGDWLGRRGTRLGHGCARDGSRLRDWLGGARGGLRRASDGHRRGSARDSGRLRDGLGGACDGGWRGCARLRDWLGCRGTRHWHRDGSRGGNRTDDRHRHGRGRRERALDCGEEVRRVDRLGEHLVVLRLLGIIAEIVAADEDRLHPDEARHHLIPQREAIHRLHDDIGDEQLDAAHGDGSLQRLAARDGRAHVVAGQRLQHGEQGLDDGLVVIDEQDSHLSGSVWSFGGGGYFSMSTSGVPAEAWSAPL